MKRTLGLGLAIAVLVTAAALSKYDRTRSTTADGELRIDQECNPWTHLRLNNDRDNFQFALVGDRTGGHRAKVFSQAVDRLNLLQPEFVITVGDLIEGYTDDKEKLAEQWKEFDGYVRKLQMPFFYVPGNHDLSNTTEDKQWGEKFGRRYYHFVYRNVLFLLLNAEERTPYDGKNAGNRDISKLSAKQIDYVKKVLGDNRNARWTIVALHRPMWTIDNGEQNGWREVEKMLEGRRYTVFAGHIHRYRKYVRNGMAYYQLATTGGGSKMRGVRYGEFDHIAWITMKKDGPILANVMLDGVYPEDMTVPASNEPGVPERNHAKTYPTAGKVVLEGKPVPNATVVVWAYNPKTKRYGRVADGLTESDGSYRLSTYKAFDGASEGEYTLTATRHEPQFDETGRMGPNKLPERYGKPETSPLKGTVRSGNNTIDLELSR